jgi:hypothetical protein
VRWLDGVTPASGQSRIDGNLSRTTLFGRAADKADGGDQTEFKFRLSGLNAKPGHPREANPETAL